MLHSARLKEKLKVALTREDGTTNEMLNTQQLHEIFAYQATFWEGVNFGQGVQDSVNRGAIFIATHSPLLLEKLVQVIEEFDKCHFPE